MGHSGSAHTRAQQEISPTADRRSVKEAARINLSLYLIVVLGCGKPSERPGFQMAGSRLERRADAGIEALLSLMQQGKQARLLFTGAFDEAKLMAKRARFRLDQAGLDPSRAASLIHMETNSRTTVENAWLCRCVPIAPPMQDNDGDGKLRIRHDSSPPSSSSSSSLPLHCLKNLHVFVVSGLGHLPRSIMLFKSVLPNATTVRPLPAYGGDEGAGNIENDAKFLTALLRSARLPCVRGACIREARDFMARIKGKLPNRFAQMMPFRRRHRSYLQLRTAYNVQREDGGTMTRKEKKNDGKKQKVEDKKEPYGLHIDGPAKIMSQQQPLEKQRHISAHRVRFGPLCECSDQKATEWAFVDSGDGEWKHIVNRWYPHTRLTAKCGGGGGGVLAMENVPDECPSAKWKIIFARKTDDAINEDEGDNINAIDDDDGSGHGSENYHQGPQKSATASSSSASYPSLLSGKPFCMINKEGGILHVERWDQPLHPSFGRVECTKKGGRRESSFKMREHDATTNDANDRSRKSHVHSFDSEMRQNIRRKCMMWTAMTVMT
mmetsp:Transcript_31575/g.51288  ORF Transcript_31575/g.51288 Transcript_31575/m.51288 type:complete len:551 (+) Transcript_31575:201-1853(+)